MALKIPGTLNIALALVIVSGGLGLHAFAARSDHLLLCGLVFSFLYLPLYSLIHEAEHRVFHKHPAINDGFGVLLAALFGGPFSFLRACHLGHHRRNRTDAEMFELCYPEQSLFKRRAFFYFMYTGGFWLTIPITTLLLVVWPSVLHTAVVQDAPSVAAMANGVPKRYLRRIRLEALGVIALHAAMIWGLSLTPASYLTLYGLLAINWSSQQYITHAHSPRHVLNGAHNLRAPWLYSVWLLHFNWHLAHHQNPGVSWIHLPKFDDSSRERPGYGWAFLRFWRGPVRTEERGPEALPRTDHSAT